MAWSTSDAIDRVRDFGTFPLLYTLASIWIAQKLIRSFYVALRHRFHSTPLFGPPNPSYLWGMMEVLLTVTDCVPMIEEWMAKYGTVFKIGAPFCMETVVLCDPKAIAHFYARETFGYHQTAFSRRSIEQLIGRGLIWSEGDDHRRQRKAISPAFTNAAIKNATSVFYDSAYKVKEAWDNIFSAASDDSIVVDVQNWMNYVSLDSIGIAGFSHHFGCLDGKTSAIQDVFEAFGEVKLTFIGTSIILLAQIFPILLKIPNQRQQLIRELNRGVEEIAENLLRETRREKAGQSVKEDKSLLGLIIKSESDDAELHMSPEEVMAQMKVLILAGYETTSISLTWSLIELCRHPEEQDKLREELQRFAGMDPTWDQLTSSIPYLDAVVHETLRLHPPLVETTRIAGEDDILPLSEPLRTPTGTVDRVHISKGQVVQVRIDAMNQAASVWGPDAKAFRPARWLDVDGLPTKAKEVQGHKHLLTFVDGPRMCLGRGFALAEFKAVLSVLIRNYSFEFADGKNPEIGLSRGILPRPKIGEEGAKVPLRIRRVE